MPADNPTCASCRWFVPDPAFNNGIGCCRRHAPRPMFAKYESVQTMVTSWPYTNAEKWCGEHAPRVAAPKGGKPIVDSEMRLYDLASFRACATERGVTLTGNPLPGDGFVFGSTSYIYDPESPDAPR